MVRCLRRGSDAAFTIDGPSRSALRGEAGLELQLAKATGAAILCFHAAVRRALVFRKSWDLKEFPLPFTRAAMFVAPIRVPQDADRRPSRPANSNSCSLPSTNCAAVQRNGRGVDGNVRL